MVMRVLPEAVEGEEFGFLDIGLALGPADIGQDMQREAAVAVTLTAHFQAETDHAGFEHIGAAIVLHDIALGDGHFPSTGIDVGQDFLHGRHVGQSGNALVAGFFQHRREFAAQQLYRPVDGVGVDDRVGSAMDAHATADATGCRQFGVFRTVDVAALEIEAVEP